MKILVSPCDAQHMAVRTGLPCALEHAGCVLKEHLDHEKLKSCALLVYANKQDLPNAIMMSSAEVADKMGLFDIEGSANRARLSMVKGCMGVWTGQ